MPRQKKDYRMLSIKLSTPIHEQLEQFCDEARMTKTIAVEKILQHFFIEYFKRPETDRTLFYRENRQS